MFSGNINRKHVVSYSYREDALPSSINYPNITTCYYPQPFLIDLVDVEVSRFIFFLLVLLGEINSMEMLSDSWERMDRSRLETLDSW